MSEIQRDLKSILKSRIEKGKIIILIGPRQVGKTTLFKSMISEAGFLDCDVSERNSVDNPPARLPCLAFLSVNK